MRNDEIVNALMAYIGEEILEGDTGDFDASTPLLELGLIDSFSLVGLLSFIESDLKVELSLESVTPENLQDVDAIARWISSATASSSRSP